MFLVVDNEIERIVAISDTALDRGNVVFGAEATDFGFEQTIDVSCCADDPRGCGRVVGANDE